MGVYSKPRKIDERDFVIKKVQKVRVVCGQQQYMPYVLKKMLLANAHKGHLQVAFYGDMGSGKSRSVMQIFNAFGSSCFKDWNYKNVLDAFVFRRKEMLEKLNSLYEGGRIKYRIPMICLDDFTFDNMKSKKADIFEDAFMKFWTTMRAGVASVFITTPHFTLIPARLRAMNWLIAWVRKSPNDSKYAEVRYYNYKSLPTGKIVVTPVLSENSQLVELYRYSAIPKEVADEYELIRDSYTYEGINELIDAYNLVESAKEHARGFSKNYKTASMIMTKSQEAVKKKLYSNHPVTRKKLGRV